MGKTTTETMDTTEEAIEMRTTTIALTTTMLKAKEAMPKEATMAKTTMEILEEIITGKTMAMGQSVMEESML